MNHDSIKARTPFCPIMCDVYFVGHIVKGPFAGPFGRVFGLKLNSLREVECWYGSRRIILGDVVPEDGQDFSFDSRLSIRDVLLLIEGVLALCDVSLGTLGLCTFERE